MSKKIAIKVDFDDLQEIRLLVIGKIQALNGSDNILDVADAKKFEKLLVKLEAPKN